MDFEAKVKTNSGYAYFEKVRDAIRFAEKGETIVLRKDVVLTENLTGKSPERTVLEWEK